MKSRRGEAIQFSLAHGYDSYAKRGKTPHARSCRNYRDYGSRRRGSHRDIATSSVAIRSRHRARLGGTWNTGTGACSGSSSTLVSGVPLATMPAATPVMVSPTVTGGSVLHLQIALELPDQNETTTNGVPPADSIQGLTSGG
jgi:hypothetical protein